MPPSKRLTIGLKIRESKTLVIFLEGLTKYPVMSYKEISGKIYEGYEKHTIGSRVMNVTIFLSYIIVTIEFNQI